MNIDNRATKLYLKKLPPVVAVELLEKYMIPSPYKEILIAICVKRKSVYETQEYLAKDPELAKHWHLEYLTIVRKFKIGLELFRESNKLDNNRYLS